MIQAKSTTISKKIDLSAIPEEYHEYADVFSKSKAETLALHRPYDLRINLEKDSQLLQTFHFQLFRHSHSTHSSY